MVKQLGRLIVLYRTKVQLSMIAWPLTIESDISARESGYAYGLQRYFIYLVYGQHANNTLVNTK